MTNRIELSRTVTQNWSGSGTGTGVSRGSFALQKGSTTDSEPFATDSEFSVRVEEFAPGNYPDGEAEDTYDVTVTPDEPVSGQFSRGNGWTVRLTEIGFPDDAGVIWEQGTFVTSPGVTVDDQGRAIVEMTPGTNVPVQLNNTASLGSIRVTKDVVGDAADDVPEGQAFSVTAHVDADGDGPAGSRDVPFTLRDGQYVDIEDLPVGAEVTFSEVRAADTDLITWAEPVFDPSSVVVGQDTVGYAVSLTNTASQTEGSFTLQKELKGPEADNDAVPETFEVLATWTDADGVGQEETLTVNRNGDVVDFPHDLPGGTEVTLTESVPDDGDGLAWGSPVFSGDGVSIDGGTAVVTIGLDDRAVTVTNTVDTNTGDLRVIESMGGEAADLVPGDAEFTVEATWQDGDTFRSKDLTVGADAPTSLDEELPVGTQVTFTETGTPDIPGVEGGFRGLVRQRGSDLRGTGATGRR